MDTAATHTLHIGICRLSSLGDVALSTVCLDLLVHAPRPVKVYWVGMPPHDALLAHSPIALTHITVSPTAKWHSILHAAQQLQHLHLFVDLQKNLRSQALAELLHWRWNIPYCSYDKQRLRRLWLLLAARVRGRRRPAPASIRTAGHPQYMRMRATLAKALQIEERHAKPRLQVTASSRHNRIAVAIGASYPTKRAPHSLLVKILRRVVTLHRAPLSLYIFGNAQEYTRATALSAALTAHATLTCKNFCGQLSLQALPAMLASVSVLLCNDSGLLHVAEAVGTPVVALFGPTVEAFGFSPWQTNSCVFSSQLGCRPCSRHGAAPCRYRDLRCFTTLDSEAIALAVQRRITT